MAIPVVEQKLCTGCGECAEMCEANAIEIAGEKARIDYRKCYNYNMEIMEAIVVLVWKYVPEEQLYR